MSYVCTMMVLCYSWLLSGLLTVTTMIAVGIGLVCWSDGSSRKDVLTIYVLETMLFLSSLRLGVLLVTMRTMIRYLLALGDQRLLIVSGSMVTWRHW